MNKKINPILAILILFLVVAAVGVVSWWIAQQEGKQTLSQLTKKQAVQSIPEEDKTKNWQTYRSEEYGFEFKYPPIFYMKGAGEQVFLTKKNSTMAEQIDSSDELVEIRVSSMLRRFDSYYNTLDNTEVKGYGDMKIRTRMINNYKAVEYGYNEADKEKEIRENQEAMKSGASVGVTLFNRGLIINKDGTIIEILTDSYNGKFKDIFDQIISTFKFIEKGNCLGSCKCMEKCNESGPVYFIPVEDDNRECFGNRLNKICCCSGV